MELSLTPEQKKNIDVYYSEDNINKDIKTLCALNLINLIELNKDTFNKFKIKSD